MTPSAPPRGHRRGRGPIVRDAQVADDSDPASDLLGGIKQGVAVIVATIRELSVPPIAPDNVDRITVLTEKATVIRGQIVRADANVTRRKPTLASVEKDIAGLSPDERAHLIEKLGGGGDGNVLK